MQLKRVFIVGAISIVLCALLSACPRPWADCAWSGTVKAWLDENENGSRDPTEGPAAEIQFWVDDIHNKYTRVSGAVSDTAGEARIMVWMPGCPRVALEVYPQVSSQYRVTTPERLPVDQKQDASVFQFGVKYLPAGIPTPRPTGQLSCVSYNGPSGNRGMLAVAPDGSLWAKAFIGTVHVVPAGSSAAIQGQKPAYYTTSDGLVGDQVTDIAVGAEGVVWFTTYDGVSRLKDGVWTSYRAKDVLPDDVAIAVTVTSDGGVWVITDEGISRLDPVTGQWTTSRKQTNFGRFRYTTMTSGPDGTAWLKTDDSIYQLAWRPGVGNEGIEARQVYATGAAGKLTRIEDMSLAPDGSFWLLGPLANETVIAHFDPASGSSTLFSFENTGGALYSSGLLSIAAGPDGSVWLGTYSRGLLNFRPGVAAGDPGRWTSYPPPSDSYIGELAIEPGGALWVLEDERAQRCVVQGEGQ